MRWSPHLPQSFRQSVSWLVCSSHGYWPSSPLLRPISILGLLLTPQLPALALVACGVLQAPLRTGVLLSSDQATSDSSLVT